MTTIMPVLAFGFAVSLSAQSSTSALEEVLVLESGERFLVNPATIDQGRDGEREVVRADVTNTGVPDGRYEVMSGRIAADCKEGSLRYDLLLGHARDGTPGQAVLKPMPPGVYQVPSAGSPFAAILTRVCQRP